MQKHLSPKPARRNAQDIRRRVLCRNNGKQFFIQIFPEIKVVSADAFEIGGERREFLFCGGFELHDRKRILRSAAKPVFLPAPENMREQIFAFAPDQGARAAHAPDLMRAHRIKIDVFRKAERNFPESLHAVGVKKRPRILFFDFCGEARDVVDRARFVVHVNDGNERRLFVDEAQNIGFVRPAETVELCKAHVDPPAGKFLRRLIDRGVFAFRRDEIPAPGARKERLIVRFAPARGKHEFELRGIGDVRKNIFPRRVQPLMYGKTLFIKRGRVEKIFPQEAKRFPDRLLVGAGRCGVVKVDHLI